jgi:1-acyl-sn-glycerol-3-phosphate acyltransferase
MQACGVSAHMLAIRSLLFNVFFYINIIFWMLVSLFTLPFPRQAFYFIARTWTKTWLWAMRVICGTTYEIRGREHLPKGGYIVAAKHQSTWETFALFLVFKDPCFIFKRELAFVPLFGLFPLKTRMVMVDRKGGIAAMSNMNKRVREEIAHDRQVIIFPEGTRTAPGAPPAYKMGFAHLYKDLDATIVPMALNAGLFWPRRKFLRYPGTIIVEFLPPVPPGLDKGEAFARTRDAIETASNRLMDEARTAGGPLST